MSWFWNIGWDTLGKAGRKLALASSYPPIIPRRWSRDPTSEPWWHVARWDGSKGHLWGK